MKYQLLQKIPISNSYFNSNIKIIVVLNILFANDNIGATQVNVSCDGYELFFTISNANLVRVGCPRTVFFSPTRSESSNIKRFSGDFPFNQSMATTTFFNLVVNNPNPFTAHLANNSGSSGLGTKVVNVQPNITYTTPLPDPILIEVLGIPSYVIGLDNTIDLYESSSTNEGSCADSTIVSGDFFLTFENGAALSSVA